MAFTKETFSPGFGQGSNAPTINTYLTILDNATAVETSGYFNNIEYALKVGDLIITYQEVDHYHGFYYVSSLSPVVINKIVGA